MDGRQNKWVAKRDPLSLAHPRDFSLLKFGTQTRAHEHWKARFNPVHRAWIFAGRSIFVAFRTNAVISLPLIEMPKEEEIFNSIGFPVSDVSRECII